MMLCVIDIDDCISDGRRRAQLAGAEPNRQLDVAAYSRWCSTINRGIEHDVPVAGMCTFVQALASSAYAQVIYVTARGEDLRGLTEDWLKLHGFPRIQLFMRPRGDVRTSAAYKESVISKQATADHEPVIVVDDDVAGAMAHVCRRRGWTLLKAVSCLGG